MLGRVKMVEYEQGKKDGGWEPQRRSQWEHLLCDREPPSLPLLSSLEKCQGSCFEKVSKRLTNVLKMFLKGLPMWSKPADIVDTTRSCGPATMCNQEFNFGEFSLLCIFPLWHLSKVSELGFFIGCTCNKIVIFCSFGEREDYVGTCCFQEGGVHLVTGGAEQTLRIHPPFTI